MFAVRAMILPLKVLFPTKVSGALLADEGVECSHQCRPFRDHIRPLTPCLSPADFLI